MKISNLCTIIILAFLCSSCGDDDRNEVVYPRKYLYSNSTIIDQGAYSVTNNVAERIEGNVGDLAETKKYFNDSLNSTIAPQILQKHLMDFELLSPNKIRITDYNPSLGIIVNEETYTLNGNQIITDRDQILTLSSDFSEIIVLVKLYSYSGMIGPNSYIVSHDFDLCTTTDPLINIQNIVNDNIGIVAFDTISLDYVNMIYSRQ